MAMIDELRSCIRYLSKNEVTLFKTINGDAFFPLKSWPGVMRISFWQKPIGDRECFKLFLFCLGNGCSPNLIGEWIMLSQMWADYAKAEKRARQMDFILNNWEAKKRSWFYFDVDYNKLLYLNGLPKK